MYERCTSSLTATLCAFLLALLVAPSPATAGWGPDGVTITTATTVSRPQACSDGAYGTFIAWHELDSSARWFVRLEHLLSTGDLDPSWPEAGVLLANSGASISLGNLLPDRLGGVYVFWYQASGFMVTRVGVDGSIATGWSATGRGLGAPDHPSLRSVIEDGQHGFYAVWRADGLPFETLEGIHLGADNLGAGGWPNYPRVIAPSDPIRTNRFWPQLTLAPDGGVFVAWATWSSDTTNLPSTIHMRRLNTAGGAGPGWEYEPVSIAPFRPEALSSSSLLALSGDGRGGVFVLHGRAVEEASYTPAIEPRLYRLQGAGETAPDWPAEGRVLEGISRFLDVGPDGSYHVLADGSDGAFVGLATSYPYDYYEYENTYAYWRCAASGVIDPLPVARGNLRGHRAVSSQAGRIFLATTNEETSCGWEYSISAFTRLDLAPRPGGSMVFSDYHLNCVTPTTWFNGVALASSGDGGVVFFWAQVRDRVGLFARRFTGGGEVTGVPPPAGASLSLSGLRFVPGAGVRAALRIPAGANARLTLHDIAGRRITSDAIESGARDHTVGGTVALSSGLYFARLSSAGETVTGKVFVLR